MTVTEILLKIAPVKSMTRETLYTHLRELKIKPLSRVRQIPQHYPDDAADRVLNRLGLKPPKKCKLERPLVNGHSSRRSHATQLRRAA